MCASCESEASRLQVLPSAEKGNGNDFKLATMGGKGGEEGKQNFPSSASKVCASKAGGRGEEEKKGRKEVGGGIEERHNGAKEAAKEEDATVPPSPIHFYPFCSSVSGKARNSIHSNSKPL